MATTLVLALFAVLAGAFSVLTPCVLVMLPALLAITGGEGRRRVVGVLIGLELSFVGISLLAAAAFTALGLPPRTQQLAAVAILAMLGVTMLVPALRERLQLATSRAVGRVPGLARSASGGEGLRGGLLGGLGLGLVWAPCAGPFLAAITAGAVTDGFTTRTVMMAIGFGLGMLVPLLLVLQGGHAMVGRIRGRFGARRLDVVMGIAMLGTAVLVASGGFTSINRQIAERVNLTSTPIAAFERDALARADEDDLARVRARGAGNAGGSGRGSDRPSDAELDIAGYPESRPGELRRLGDAPTLVSPQRTYNVPEGEQLDADFLRGKVVVYDFWTYSCINCIRTLPYLRTLHARYADEGLVIVGVHAPEFAFEADEDNVREAIDDLDVTWPVATDPRLRTWEAFENQYWPAKYVVDRDGELRYVHYGEGAYDETEAVILELLGKDPARAGMAAPRPVDYAANTPETYLGFERMSSSQWRGHAAGAGARVAPDAAIYEQAGDTALRRHEYTLVGPWRIEHERSIATGDDARIELHYRARAVYLVLDPGPARSAEVVVRDSAEKGGRTRRVVVDEERLYTLRDGAATADATLRIDVPRGVSAYAFTFG